MRVIPALDLLDGRVAFLRGGPPAGATVVGTDPVVTALRWQEAGAKALQVIDLDAALGRGDNSAVIGRLLRAVSLPVQVGGGLRDDATVAAVLERPGTRAIVATRAIREPGWLAGLADRYPGRLVLGVDHLGTRVLVRGRADRTARPLGELLAAANALDLAGVLFTDVAAEGTLRGVAPLPSTLVGRCRHARFAAGGVRGTEDLGRLERAGFDGAVVGLALYAGGPGAAGLIGAFA